MAQITGTKYLMIQSSDLLLQGTGSTSANGIIAGVHLRWDLIGSKQNVLPKGNGDTVRIYRSRYTEQHKQIYDLTSRPTDIHNSELYSRWWNYAGLFMHFMNITKYDQVKAKGIVEGTSEFIVAYGDMMEIEVDSKMMFSVALLMDSTSGKLGVCRMETISQTRTDNSTRFISNRQSFDVGEGTGGRLLKEDEGFLCLENMDFILLEEELNNVRCTAENISSVRFMAESCYPICIEIETYDDYLYGENTDNAWTELTALGLSLDSNTVSARLEGAPGSINGKWAHYIGGTVNTANYMNKWNSNDDSGLRSAVDAYINPKSGDDYGMPIPSILKLLALDYHVARMLGLGYIDTTAATNSNEYIYAARYGDDVYMTLPLSRNTLTFVPAPKQKSIAYGLRVSNGTTTPVKITDERGYYYDKEARAIGLSVEQVALYRPMEAFFYTQQSYSFVHQMLPVMFGVKYRKVGTTVWTELNVNPDFGNEVVPLITNPNGTLYIHTEIESGKHDYAIYGIDYFGRPTELSNSQTTDDTLFPKRNSLMPPLNFSAQLIQPEKTLILTSQKEQEMLSGLTGFDKTLVRITFDWNDVNNSVYWYGKTVGFFFRTAEISLLKGRVKSVADTMEEGVYLVKTEGYTQYSNGTTISPTIAARDVNKYIGSLLATNEEQYRIEELRLEADGMPSFVVRSFKKPAMYVAEDGQDTMFADDYIIPRVGTQFSVRENILTDDRWGGTPFITANLQKLSDHEEEMELETASMDGRQYAISNTTMVKVGGLYGTAAITAMPELGVYNITFSANVKLPANPNATMLNGEWYKGTVRIKLDGTMHTLEVINITAPTNGILVVTAYDAAHGERVAAYFAKNFIYVNFHPGYRLYLKANSNTLFDAAHILPGEHEDTKQTFLACCSMDNEFSFKSYMSPPAVIYARKIYEAKRPTLLTQKFNYAGRPDFYGRSAYTFDVEVNTIGGRTPYTLLFYRYMGKRSEAGWWEADSTTGVPLTSKPLFYSDIPEGKETSRTKPAVRFIDNGKTFVRFTDYTLEGAANICYFYNVVEIDNTMRMSAPSGYTPAVRLLNTIPPPAPVLRKVRARTANSFIGETTAVSFEVNPYPKQEGITKIRIYRALSAANSHSIRTMEFAKEWFMDGMDELADTFDGLSYPLYGELLYYRLVAVRTIKNEKGTDEDIYSLPTKCIMANIEDTENPPIPSMTYNEDTTELVWEPICYKGNYYLYKMSSLGNWTLLNTFSKILDTVTCKLDPLPEKDEDGNTIYHHFKLVAENSSGLRSISEILTIVKTVN